jgi:hypothetical protein
MGDRLWDEAPVATGGSSPNERGDYYFAPPSTLDTCQLFHFTDFPLEPQRNPLLTFAWFNLVFSLRLAPEGLGNSFLFLSP